MAKWLQRETNVVSMATSDDPAGVLRGLSGNSCHYGFRIASRMMMGLAFRSEGLLVSLLVYVRLNLKIACVIFNFPVF